MSVASRVAKLSHAALVELVVAACEGSPTLKNRADALVAEVAPLPAWCVEVLLSPDLLSACFSSLKLADGRVAATCRAWRRGWKGHLAALRAVLPTVQSTHFGLPSANGLCVRADGTLAVSCSTRDELSGNVTAFIQLDSGPQLRGPRGQPDVEFDWLTSLKHSDGALFVSDGNIIRRLGPDGTQLASYRHPDAEEENSDLAVHQPTGVLFAAVTLEAEHGLKHVVLQLDAATLEPQLDADGEPAEFASEVLDPEFPKTVAVEGDRVLVTEMKAPSHHRHYDFIVNIVHVFSLDGTLIRTIEGCGFGPPCAMIADQGRVYLIENRDDDTEAGDVPEWASSTQIGEDFKWLGRRLFVIDIETGSVLQQVRLEEARWLTDVAVHGGQVFLSDIKESCIFVLQIAQAAASA